MKRLPSEFAVYIKGRLSDSPSGVADVRRHLLRHLDYWRRSPLLALPLPGYRKPPANAPGKDYPPGWSLSNFQHHGHLTEHDRQVIRLGNKQTT